MGVEKEIKNSINKKFIVLCFCQKNIRKEFVFMQNNFTTFRPEINDVKIKKVDGDKLDRLKAYVDITLDESLVIHGLKLMQGEQGLFVAMPSRKMRNEEYKDIVHPICPDLRNYITKVVEEKYNSIEEETTVEIA